jgi:hypothetical protein
MTEKDITEFYEGTGHNAMDLMKMLDGERWPGGIERAFDGSVAMYANAVMVIVVSCCGPTFYEIEKEYQHLLTSCPPLDGSSVLLKDKKGEIHIGFWSTLDQDDDFPEWTDGTYSIDAVEWKHL